MQNNINSISHIQNIPSSEEKTSPAANDQSENQPQLKSRPQPDIIIDAQGQRFRNGVELFYDHEDESENQTVRELRDTLTTPSTNDETSKQPRQDKTATVRARASSKANAATEPVASQCERLRSAIKNGDIETVQQLIGQNPDLPGEAHQYGVSPVFEAVSCDQFAIAEILVQKGASTAHLDNVGSTALHRAITGGHRSLAEMLIHSGVPVDQVNDAGQTPLMMAIEKGQTELARLLIDKNAVIDRADNKGDTPLTLACKLNQPQILEMLLAKLPSRAAVDALTPAGFSLLMLAAESGHENIVKLLLDYGATIDMPGNNNRTALMFACELGHTPVVEFLLARGAAPNQKANGGVTALMIACELGHTPEVQLLLSHGARPDREMDGGVTALMLSCRKGHTPVVQLLLAHGARPDQKMNDGDTALMFASLFGHTPVVKLLLAHGARLDRENILGGTALMIACECGNAEIVELLFGLTTFSDKYPQQLATMLEIAAHRGHAKVLDFLLENSNTFLESARSMLYSRQVNLAHLALQQGHHEALAILIKHRIPFDYSSGAALKSILKAADRENVELLRLLINKFSSLLPLPSSSWLGESVLTRYLHFQKALIKAVRHDRHDIASLLIKAGVKPDYIIENGNSALREAIRQGNLEMLFLMLDQTIKFSRQHPSDKLSSELLLAISSDTANPMLVDTLLNFENEKALKKGSFSFALDFDRLFDGLQKLLLKSYIGTKKSSFPQTDITTMLCTEFNLSYLIADRLAVCLKKIVDANFSSSKSDGPPNENQLRMAFTDSVASEQLFNDLTSGDDDFVEKCYDSHAQAPALAKKLARTAASQTILLIATADTAARQYLATLRSYLDALTSSTTSLEIQEFMNQAGWHPLVTELVVDCWESLNESRTKDALFEAISARLGTTEYAEKFEQLSSDTARLLVHLQMNRLREIVQG